MILLALAVGIAACAAAYLATAEITPKLCARVAGVSAGLSLCVLALGGLGPYHAIPAIVAAVYWLGMAYIALSVERQAAMDPFATADYSEVVA